MTSDGLMRTTTARLFDAFWAGGISNPLEIVDQISHLLYFRELDRVQERWDQRLVPSETMDKEPPFAQDEQHLRWSHLIRMTPQRMYATIADDVFPWLRSHTFTGLAYSQYLRDARFTIPTPSLLAKAVDLLHETLSSSSDAEAADLYEHLLTKVATAGSYGVFRTPLHLTALMVLMTEPGLDDEVCDPTCGMGGLLTAAAQFMLTSRSGAVKQNTAGVSGRLHGFDFDMTMLRLISMRLALHGFGAADLRYRDNLSAGAGTEVERYSVVLANPPFAGSVDYETVAPELLEAVRTKKSEILHIIAILRLLRPGGRAAVIVPDGLLFGSTAAHIELRRILVEEHGLEGVVKLPNGIFKPYAGVSTAVLFFTKDAGPADYVWLYDLKADGWSLDDRRVPLLTEDKLGLTPESTLDAADHTRNNLPDLMRRWHLRKSSSERQRTRSEQSFCVARAEIAADDYNLALENFRRIHEMHRVAQEGVRLGDFAQIFSGSVRKSDLDTAAEVTDTDGRRQVLTPTLLTDTLPDVADLPVLTDQREPQHRLRQGDIIGRDLAGNRHWTSVPSHYDGVQPGQGLIVIRLTQEVLPREYVIAYLSSFLAEQQLPKFGTIPRIRVRAMADIWIPECEGDLSEIRASLVMLTEGEQEAARLQDELRRARDRIFESGSGPVRRGRLDDAAAISSLTAQNLRRHNDPYMLFQDSYPYAIARAVRKFRHSRLAVEKHEAAIQCAESLILSLGIMALAVATDRGRQDLPAIAQWSQSVERGGVSLGHWVGVVKAVAQDARQHGEPAAGLVKATVRKKGGKGLVADLDQLVKLRNKIRHGAGPRTRAELEKSLESIEPLMLSSLSGCAFLARTLWVHTERLQWNANSGKFRVSGMALMGDHPDFATATFDTTHPLLDEHLYLITPHDAPLLLSPFCLLSDCPACLAPELYYPDRMTNSTALLKSLDRGHELDSESVFKALREWSASE